MGHARRQLPHRCHFFSLKQFGLGRQKVLFERETLGDVFNHHHPFVRVDVCDGQGQVTGGSAHIQPCNTVLFNLRAQCRFRAVHALGQSRIQLRKQRPAVADMPDQAQCQDELGGMGIHESNSACAVNFQGWNRKQIHSLQQVCLGPHVEHRRAVGKPVTPVQRSSVFHQAGLLQCTSRNMRVQLALRSKRSVTGVGLSRTEKI